MANQNATLGNLHLARKQLDELDALVQRMLDLPEAQAGGTEEETSLTNQGLFNPTETPWAPTAEKKEAIAQKQAATVHYTTLDTPNTKPAPTADPIPGTNPLQHWKPSSLTWAPLAQAWEKKLTVSSPQLEETVPSQKTVQTPATFKTLETQSATTPTPKPDAIKPLPPHSGQSSTPVNPAEKKNPWMDVIGFLGIMLLVFAAVLFLTGSFHWPWR